MDERTRVLVRLAAALTGGEEDLRGAMDEAARVAPDEAEEVLLQSHLFLGFPVALNGLGLWRRRTDRPAPPRREEDLDELTRRGEEVCREVYARQYEALRAVMEDVHPDLDTWAVRDGYGKILGREGLDLGTRELCVAAQLAGVDASRQLHAHLRGCLNVGVPAEEVAATLDAVRDLLPARRMREADRVWARVRKRWETKAGG